MKEQKARRLLAFGYTAQRVADDTGLPIHEVQTLLADVRASRVPTRKYYSQRASAIERLRKEGYGDDAIRAVFGEI